jgi:type II secretory pathway component PulK
MRRRSKKQPRRKAVVIIAVLVVVTVLALAAYQFTELMSAEHKAADTYRKSAQARAMADSGIHYAMAVLSNPDTVTNTLNSNPFDNSGAFAAQMIQAADPGKRQPRFSIVAPLSPDETQTASGALFRYGVIDESGKINLNSLLKWDATGQKGHDLLMLLPNMTDDIASSIMDWLDPDEDTRTNGAESDYYQTLNPPYNAKNGPLDTLDELLLVKGVTPQLLYGNDANHNGVFDADEVDAAGNGTVDMGWSAYLTVFTHETNVDSSGNPRINLNDSDLNGLSDKLIAAVGEDLANYIIAYRLYGSNASQGGAGAGAGGAGASGAGGAAASRAGTGGAAAASAPLSSTDRAAVNSQLAQARTNSSQQQLHKINSIFDLVNSTVGVPSDSAGGGGAAAGGGGRGGTTTQIAISFGGDRVAVASVTTQQSRTITYPSPMNDPSQLASLLPLLLDSTTTTKDTDLPGRVNVNTAPQAVLTAIGLSDSDVQTIISQRPDPSAGDAPDPSFQTLAWLITKANVDANTVKSLETYLTAHTQVYRVQSVGYFDGDGPTVRIEAVIDTNNGRPRILLRRDLTDLGKGFDLQNGQ